VEKIVHTVEDVAAGEESAEDLGVVRMQPIAPNLKLCFPRTMEKLSRSCVRQIVSSTFGFKEKRAPDAEGGPESHAVSAGILDGVAIAA